MKTIKPLIAIIVLSFGAVAHAQFNSGSTGADGTLVCSASNGFWIGKYEVTQALKVI